jgi:hypothetical protein
LLLSAELPARRVRLFVPMQQYLEFLLVTQPKKLLQPISNSNRRTKVVQAR